MSETGKITLKKVRENMNDLIVKVFMMFYNGIKHTNSYQQRINK